MAVFCDFNNIGYEQINLEILKIAALKYQIKKNTLILAGFWCGSSDSFLIQFTWNFNIIMADLSKMAANIYQNQQISLIKGYTMFRLDVSLLKLSALS